MACFPIIGFFQVFVFIPIIPEMIERLQVSNNIKEGQDELLDGQLNDKVNDMYGLIYALSMFISPLIGSQLYTVYGSSTTCDVCALFNLVFGVVIFVLNCGFFFVQENRKFKQKLASLKQAVN